ncbi:MAG TPA: ATP-binding protein [Thermoanaerobaculia bacterium]|nr:ATP-binding protein [Thermoanaerobaculia bacterium]
MKLTGATIKNFRSIEDVHLDFPSYYAALSGKNNSGKTNVLRALRSLLKESDPYGFSYGETPNVKEDYPKWKAGDKDKYIEIGIELLVYPDQDEGLFKFITTYLSLAVANGSLAITLSVRYVPDQDEPKLSLSVNNAAYEELQAQEILSKLQSSKILIFHNSTELDRRFRYPRDVGGILDELAIDSAEQVEKLKTHIDRAFSKIALKHQKDLSELLGRLNEKYRVGLTIPKLDVEYMPFSITLGDKAAKVPLEDWGSGTKNRTRILMALFRAKRIGTAATSASKTTPIIVIEEPESFLHPSAQAEFGRVLQDLAEEFRVQVIVTTHSPYMLSQARPESNVLLDRVAAAGQLRQTVRQNTVGDKWMEPFGVALGIDNAEFRPWRDVFFGSAQGMLMVEGDTDKEFFELLRDPAHGEHRLLFDGEIFPYGGKDVLKNSVLLKFVRERFRQLFITYDLDAEDAVCRCLSSLGLQRNKDFAPVGRDEKGKKAIEGLLPDSIVRDVYAEHSDLVAEALHGTSDEQRSARHKLKRLMLDRFKAVAVAGEEYYGKFYPLVKTINKAMQRAAA